MTLADRHIYSTFQPLLYQVATAGLAPSDVAYPLRSFAHKYGAHFRHGELASVDTAARVAQFADGGRFEYDYLILAVGVMPGFYGITGAAEHSHALYTLHDASALRERILAGLEELSLDSASQDVTVTIVGGGATGVELAGTLAELRNIGLPASYPDIDPQCVHIRLVEQAPAWPTPYVPALQDYARKAYRTGRDDKLRAEGHSEEYVSKERQIRALKSKRRDAKIGYYAAWIGGILCLIFFPPVGIFLTGFAIIMTVREGRKLRKEMHDTAYEIKDVRQSMPEK